jgi:hypothetical protein
MPNDQPGLILTGLICGGIAGAFCGAVAYSVAAWKKRQGLGAAALVVCTLCGLVLGLLLAVPVALVFIVTALALGEPQSAADRPSRDDEYSDYDGRLGQRRRESVGDDHGRHWDDGRRGGTADAGSDLMQQATTAYRAGRDDEAMGLFQRIVDDPVYAKDHEFARNCLDTLRKKKAGESG